MDRFSAYLLVKSHLRRPERRAGARVLASVVEGLARALGADQERWGVLALLSRLDDEYAEHNPDRRGITAAEQAELEGLDVAGCALLATWREDTLAPAARAEGQLAAALVVAEAALSWWAQRRSAGLAELPSGGADLALFWERERAELAERLDAALVTLGDDSEALAEAALEGLRGELEARP